MISLIVTEAKSGEDTITTAVSAPQDVPAIEITVFPRGKTPALQARTTSSTTTFIPCPNRRNAIFIFSGY